MANYIHVVLTEDLPNFGKSGELVRVRPGYARNFLIPRGLAVGATEENVARIEHEKKVAEARAAKTKKAAEELAGKLANVKVTIHKPVGEGDRLYGSVTSRDVEEALAAQGYVVDRRRIEAGTIKALGTYQIPNRLATSVTATIDVTVAAKA
jgi:large subunit ribosomal protein L9